MIDGRRPGPGPRKDDRWSLSDDFPSREAGRATATRPMSASPQPPRSAGRLSAPLSREKRQPERLTTTAADTGGQDGGTSAVRIMFANAAAERRRDPGGGRARRVPVEGGLPTRANSNEQLQRVMESEGLSWPDGTVGGIAIQVGPGTTPVLIDGENQKVYLVFGSTKRETSDQSQILAALRAYGEQQASVDGQVAPEASSNITKENGSSYRTVFIDDEEYRVNLGTLEVARKKSEGKGGFVNVQNATVEGKVLKTLSDQLGIGPQLQSAREVVLSKVAAEGALSPGGEVEQPALAVEVVEDNKFNRDGVICRLAGNYSSTIWRVVAPLIDLNLSHYFGDTDGSSVLPGVVFSIDNGGRMQISGVVGTESRSNNNPFNNKLPRKGEISTQEKPKETKSIVVMGSGVLSAVEEVLQKSITFPETSSAGESTRSRRTSLRPTVSRRSKKKPDDGESQKAPEYRSTKLSIDVTRKLRKLIEDANEAIEREEITPEAVTAAVENTAMAGAMEGHTPVQEQADSQKELNADELSYVIALTRNDGFIKAIGFRTPLNRSGQDIARNFLEHISTLTDSLSAPISKRQEEVKGALVEGLYNPEDSEDVGEGKIKMLSETDNSGLQGGETSVLAQAKRLKEAFGGFVGIRREAQRARQILEALCEGIVPETSKKVLTPETLAFEVGKVLDRDDVPDSVKELLIAVNDIVAYDLDLKMLEKRADRLVKERMRLARVFEEKAVLLQKRMPAIRRASIVLKLAVKFAPVYGPIAAKILIPDSVRAFAGDAHEGFKDLPIAEIPRAAYYLAIQDLEVWVGGLAAVELGRRGWVRLRSRRKIRRAFEGDEDLRTEITKLAEEITQKHESKNLSTEGGESQPSATTPAPAEPQALLEQSKQKAKKPGILRRLFGRQKPKAEKEAPTTASE